MPQTRSIHLSGCSHWIVLNLFCGCQRCVISVLPFPLLALCARSQNGPFPFCWSKWVIPSSLVCCKLCSHLSRFSILKLGLGFLLYVHVLMTNDLLLINPYFSWMVPKHTDQVVIHLCALYMHVCHCNIFSFKYPFIWLACTLHVAFLWIGPHLLCTVLRFKS